MAELIRDAPLGWIIRYLSKGKYLQYPEEKPDFKLPAVWAEMLANPDAVIVDESTAVATPAGVLSSSASTVNDDDTNNAINKEKTVDEGAPRQSLQRQPTPQETLAFTESRLEADERHDMEKIKSIPVIPKKTKDGAILVDWYYSDDSQNPHNWANNKRLGIALIICFYTFVVYTSSAIYTSSTEGVMQAFGVSQLKATLGLSLYVLGYGVGPLLFSPLSEIPRIGRNPVYIVTMFLFVIISIPTALVKNYPGLMVLRFLQGFFGSPCLASGGASLGDMYSLMALPYAMMAWVAAAYCGRKFPDP